MRIQEVESLLTEWFVKSYKGESLPLNLVDSGFVVEDGLSLNNYWQYEIKNFKDIASKYNLDENLYAKVKTWTPYEDQINKSLVLVYIYNSKNEFAFKLTISVIYKHHRYVITSNNSTVQLVSKHVIKDGNPFQLGLAILTSDDVELKDVFSKTLHVESLEKSPSFDGEVFYSVRLSYNNFNPNVDNFISFRIYLKDKNTGKLYFENRKAVFDAFNIIHKPFEISDCEKVLSLTDSKYPVAFMGISKENKEVQMYAYPRGNKNFYLNEMHGIIITDAQDNDWLI